MDLLLYLYLLVVFEEFFLLKKLFKKAFVGSRLKPLVLNRKRPMAISRKL